MWWCNFLCRAKAGIFVTAREFFQKWYILNDVMSVSFQSWWHKLMSVWIEDLPKLCVQRTILGCFYIVLSSVNASSGIVFFALKNNDQQFQTVSPTSFTYNSLFVETHIFNNDIFFFRFQTEAFEDHAHICINLHCTFSSLINKLSDTNL